MPSRAGAAQTPRQHRGRRNYHAGLAAEASVERYYTQRGWSLVDCRWRGANAEIDLIFESAGAFAFVEVKAGKTHDVAARRIGWAQLHRIMRAAELFIAQKVPGPCPDMRVDVALVDAHGQVRVLENVSMAA